MSSAAADATDSPSATACFALFLAHGLANLAADPIAAYDSLSRAVTIARGDSGNRQLEVAAGVTLSILVAADGGPMGRATDADPGDALDFLAVTIRRYHDAGSVSLLRYPLAILTTVLDSTRTPRAGLYHQRFCRNSHDACGLSTGG